MMTIDVAAAANDAVTAISGATYECFNIQSTMNRASGGNTLNGGAPRSGGSPPVVDMAQHMLRNILQGVGRSKKEVYALECELRSEAGKMNNNDDSSHNNNNNNNEEEEVVEEEEEKETNFVADCKIEATALINNNNNDGDHTDNNLGIYAEEDEKNHELENDEDATDHDGNVVKLDADEVESVDSQREDFENYTTTGCHHGGTQSVSTESVVCKYKDTDYCLAERPLSIVEFHEGGGSGDNTVECERIPACKSEQKELKRARVENIVSGMRSSPLVGLGLVNGCKKRKLYHPQQHDNSMSEYCAEVQFTDTLSEDEDASQWPVEKRKRVVEKNALKSQLRTVQEQLAEMQQKYVQLCTRIEPDGVDTDMDVDTDTDGISSDTDRDDDKHSIILERKEHISTSNSKDYSVSECAVRMSPKSAPAKITSTKLVLQSGSPSNLMSRFNPHSFPLHPNFNSAALSFLQHQIMQEQQHAAVAAAAVAATAVATAQGQLQSYRRPRNQNVATIQGHHASDNTASVYMGIGQKLGLEQDAGLVTEATALSTGTEHQQRRQSPSSPAPFPPSTRSSELNIPQIQQSSVQHGCRTGASKESGSPGHHRNSQSAAATARSFSSSAISSTLSQQQNFFALPSTKNGTNMTTTTTESAAVTGASNGTVTKNIHSGSCNDALNLENLADSLKTEITTTLAALIDDIMSRFVEKKQSPSKMCEPKQLNKDPLQSLDHHKSLRVKTGDHCAATYKSEPVPATEKTAPSNSTSCLSPSKTHSHVTDSTNISPNHGGICAASTSNPENRSGFGSSLFAAPPSKVGAGSLSNVAAVAALYSSMTNGLSGGSHLSPFCMAEMRSDAAAVAAAAVPPEQNEALSLVVPQKKKRHKVTDTRITPRTVSRILSQDGAVYPPPPSHSDAATANKYGHAPNGGSADSPPPPHQPRSFHHLFHSTSPMLPVSLPTSVAIPNPSLHESQVFSPYSPFYGAQNQPPPHHQPSSSPSSIGDHIRNSPPLQLHSSMFHPAFLAVAQQQQQQEHHQKQQQQREQQSYHRRGSSSPDLMNVLSSHGPGGDSLGPDSECNSMDFDGLPPTSSTLSPMHLRKAKLMFFWVRYPTSAVLKMYFPDIRFNKNNTAQLVKWFSNFREFYYIQMEKYARAAIADGVKNADDIHVSVDSDIYRVLNLHYNRNNHIEVPSNFRYVVEQTLKEFFKAIQMGKDQDQSWKKPIYKVIGRLDDPVPEYFKSPNFLEQLE